MLFINCLRKNTKKIFLILWIALVFFPNNNVFAKDNPLYKFEKTGWVPGFAVSDDLSYRKETSTWWIEEINLKISNNWPYLSMDSLYWWDYDSNVRYPNWWIWYIYVDTNKLAKSENITLINFPIDHWLDCPWKDNCWMNAIIYHKERKEIISILWDVNNDWRWITRANVLYENIDENTPNFLFLLDVRRYLFRDGVNKWQAATSMYIYKEDIPWSWKLSDKRLFFAWSTPLSSDFYNDKVSLFPWVTPIQYKVSSGWVSKIFNPWNVCNPILGYSSSDFDNFKKCLNEAQQFIVNTYWRAWEKDFWLQAIDKPATTVTDPNNIFDSTEELENCETIQIWCYISNLSKTIKNSIWWFFNWFSENIKNLFNSFSESIIIPIKYFFQSITNFFDYIKKNIEDLSKISFSWTMQTCIAFNSESTEKPTIAQNLVNIISVAIPFAPSSSSEVCTFDWRKIINYKTDTKFLDTIFCLFAFSSIIFTFLWSNKND